MTKKQLCYLCKKSKPKLAFTKLGFNILQCPKCKLYTLEFDQDYNNFIKDYYSREFFTGSKNRAGYVDYEGDHLPETFNMKRYITRIKRFKTQGTLLDCGCATGLFMKEAKKQGFDVHGFDVSDFAIKKAKKLFETSVQVGTFDSVSYKKSQFDVITIFDVIEHLQDPRKNLMKMRSYLKKDGLLMINTGDVDSLLAKIEGKNWHFFIPPQHLFFFSRITLTQLLEQSGYKVLGSDYKGKWVSFRYLLNLAKQIRGNKLAGLIYPYVAKNNLGKLPLYINLFDNMVIYAKKS